LEQDERLQALIRRKGAKVAGAESGGPERSQQSLVDLAVESWRFAKVFGRVLQKLDAGEGARYLSQVRYFLKRLEDVLAASGLKLVNIEGQPFDPGMAASAINIGDFTSGDPLVVDQMLEPIVMGPEGVIKSGTVTVRKEL
jgi:hypothetical protein